jgi:hypothetical protein
VSLSFQVGYGGQRNHTTQRQHLLLRQPERQLSARGMTGGHDALQVERALGGDFRQVQRGGAHIVERAGPSAAVIADAPIFQAPGRDALAGQSGAKVGNVRQIVTRPPVSAVNHDRDWVRAGSGGEAQFGELEVLRSIRQPDAAAGRRQLQDALRGK